VKFGLLICDVTADLTFLESRLVPPNMGSWNYYDPEYYQPLQTIRRAADQLGIDPDDAAAEWHDWSQKYADDSSKRLELMSDYLHALHESQEEFSAYLFWNSRNHKRGDRYPRIPNPHPKTSTSTLLAKHNQK
jgi:hypothetical protein